MITCLGLVVGVVTSAVRRDVLKQCAEFLKTHRYLGIGTIFEINGVRYCTVVDTHDFDDGMFGVLFDTDTFTEAVEV